MSDKVEIPMSEALACVHYQIEMNDLDAAKAILRILIRQAYEMERGVPIPEANTALATALDGIEVAEETPNSDAGC